MKVYAEVAAKSVGIEAIAAAYETINLASCRAIVSANSELF